MGNLCVSAAQALPTNPDDKDVENPVHEDATQRPFTDAPRHTNGSGGDRQRIQRADRSNLKALIDKGETFGTRERARTGDQGIDRLSAGSGSTPVETSAPPDDYLVHEMPRDGSQEGKVLPSLEAWLHRRHATKHTSWDRLYAVLAGSKFVLYESEVSTARRPLGYFNMSESHFCTATSSKPKSSLWSSHIRQFAFAMRTGEEDVIFATDTAESLGAWSSAVQAGNNGARFSSSASRRLSSAGGLGASDESKSEALLAMIELPTKTGPLLKHPVAKRNVKQSFRDAVGSNSRKLRFFKLENGELRYYANEDLRPSSLKGTISMRGANITAGDEGGTREGKNPSAFTIDMADGKFLELSSNLGEEDAQAWVSVLTETVARLDKSTGSKQASQRRHRILVADQQQDGALHSLAMTLSLTTDRHRGPAIHEQDPEAAAATIELLSRSLEHHFLFSKLKDLSATVESMFHRVSVPCGHMVCWQGDEGDQFYVLEHGLCEVIVDGARVSTVEPGAAFGELALIHNVPRAASVRCMRQSTLWAVERKDFRAALASTASNNQEEKIHVLQSVTLFRTLSPDMITQIAEALTEVSFAAGEYIFHQGDLGDSFYVIKSGEVVVTQSVGGAATTDLATCRAGDYFGELALMQDEPRKANVKAVTPVVECFALNRATFSSIFGSLKDVLERSASVHLLRNVRLLKDLQEAELEKIAAAVKRRTFRDGERIVVQGEFGDEFFIIQEGVVSVLIKGKQVGELGAGEYFGELALLSNKRSKRKATVVAQGAVVLQSLGRHDFVRLLGPLEGVMKREADKRKGTMSRFIGGFMTTSGGGGGGGGGAVANGASGASGILLEDLEHKGILGTGTFGQVSLVWHQPSKRHLALKAMSKQHLVDAHLEKRIFSERGILADIEHTFVVNLLATASDPHSVFMVMELLPGGDLWTLIYSRNPVLPVGAGRGLRLPHAKFYGANVLSALTFLQNAGIVYRDLKPENLALDGQGYLKLIDFGLAKKMVPGARTHTLCGTADYLAPEIIAARGYNTTADLWSFGVLLFELVARRTPFFDENESLMMNKVMNSDQFLSGSMPKNIDKTTKDVITRLLNPNPAMRLGAGVNAAQSHPWFADYRLDQLESRALNAPYVPSGPPSVTRERPADPVPYSSRVDFSFFGMQIRAPDSEGA